jgi:large subunit ribosomal protein L3
MAKGILGTKVGMTQIFNDNGHLVPVTVVSCEPNVVLQKKTMEKDGYEAIQLGFKDKRMKLANKSELGHLVAANSNPKRYLREVRGKELYNFEVGQEIRVNIFEEGETVDVTGTSKGKGFAGSIKRHNQHTGPMSHGSHYHRGPGSMGPIDPNHVRPGKNLPGHMGHETVTIQNLEIVKVDLDRNIVLVKGSVPGPKKGLVFIKRGVKADAIAPLNPEDYVVKKEEPQVETEVAEQEVAEAAQE